MTATNETRSLAIPSSAFNYLNSNSCDVNGFSGTWVQYANSIGWTVGTSI